MKISRMRQERIDKDWTLKYVAEQIQRGKVLVHNIETGKAKPSYDVLCKLEDLFGMSHRKLFKQIDDQPDDEAEDQP